MAKSSIFKDDEMQYIEDDVEKIRTKPHMYISYTGTKGALHLVKELVNNSIDEITNPESPGTMVDISFNEAENMFTSGDNGRGIPFTEVVKLSTKLQSGSKMDRENASDSAGENGVGLTAVNALSNKFKYTIYRQVAENSSQRGIFMFEEGKFLDQKITNMKGAKHGTICTYVPSKEILGDCQIDPEALFEWVAKTSYLIDKKYTIRLNIQKKGKEVEQVTKFSHKNGFADYMDVLCKDKLVAPISIHGSAENMKGVQVCFTFNPKNSEEQVDSFVNYINTVDGGVHVNATRSGITGCLIKLANEMLTDSEKKKFTISTDDCKTGLVMAINLFARRPGFTGQTKEKCGNDELFRPIRSIVYNKTMKYFKDNPKELQKIVTYLKKIARSRLEITRIRSKDIETFSSFDASVMSNFSPANSKSAYKELFLGEGDSAKGAINAARDVRYQAVLALKGVPPNAFAMKPAQVLQNAELNTLVRVSGMGIGQYFNIKNSRYKKYIISTDADIDGSNITSSLSMFFLVHWRPVVEAGMLYKALTPLYKIKDGDKYQFLVSKMRLFEAKVDNYVKNVELRDHKGHVLTKEEVRAFFTNNKNYTTILKELYGFCYTHPDIVEFTIQFSDKKDFADRLRSVFNELKYENGIITGSYQGVYQFMAVDDMFRVKAAPIKQLIDTYDDGSIYFDYKTADDSKWNKNVSIGNIINAMTKYDQTIMARWKGLGTIPENIFWETVLNPDKRVLLQLNIDDIERDMQMMKVLHGNDPKLRRELLQEYRLDKDDIDN